MNYIDFKVIITIFQEMGSPKIGDLFERLQEKVNNLREIEWEEYYRTYFFIFEKLIGTIQSEGELSNKCFQEIADLKLEAENILKENFSIEIDTLMGKNYSYLRAIDSLGIMSWDENQGKLTFFKSPTLILPMFRYISQMDNKSLKELMKSIQIIKHPNFSEEKIKTIIDGDFNHVKLFVKEFKDVLYEDLINALNIDIAKDDLVKVASIELLPTSTDFYFSGINYYKHKFQKKIPIHFTFSTTSGIIMPEEHYGSIYFQKHLPVESLFDKVRKDPVREDYFKIVREAQAKKPRAYYYELERTAASFKKTYNKLDNIDSNLAKKYKEDSVQILEKYLQLPSFSLIEVKHFPKEFNRLTLGNSKSILVSTRDRSGKIAHGISIKPREDILLKAVSDVNIEKLILSLTDTTFESLLRGNFLQNLTVAFAKGFLPLVYFGFKKIYDAKKAKDKVFEIGESIKKSSSEMIINPIKKFEKKPSMKAETLIDKLLS